MIWLIEKFDTMIDTVYINVKKVDGVLKVIGLKNHFKDDAEYLFREEDRDLTKHPLVIADLKFKQVKDYRNVKVTGSGLATYFDLKTEKYVFNDYELRKGQEDSIQFSKEGTEV